MKENENTFVVPENKTVRIGLKKCTPRNIWPEELQYIIRFIHPGPLSWVLNQAYNAKYICSSSKTRQFVSGW